jgi:hypothetical protein
VANVPGTAASVEMILPGVKVVIGYRVTDRRPSSHQPGFACNFAQIAEEVTPRRQIGRSRYHLRASDEVSRAATVARLLAVGG